MSLYDPIMDALLSRLEQTCSTTFSYYSRRFLPWEQMLQVVQSAGSPIRQPALFLFDGIGLGGGRTRYEQKMRATPKIRILERTIVIYAKIPKQMPGNQTGGPDNSTPGGSVFYPLIESVESALQVVDPSQGALTLGGLVSHCWLEGDGFILTGETDPDGQGMATLPVRIMIP